MNSRRYPRTLQEAFGPYASGPIHEPRRPIDRQDKIVMVASVVVASALLLMAIWGIL